MTGLLEANRCQSSKCRTRLWHRLRQLFSLVVGYYVMLGKILKKPEIIEHHRNCNNKSWVLLLCYYMELYIALTVLVSERVTGTSRVSLRPFVSLKSHLETITFTQTSPCWELVEMTLFPSPLTLTLNHSRTTHMAVEHRPGGTRQVSATNKPTKDLLIYFFVCNQSSLIIFLFSLRYYCTKRFWCH